MKAELHIVSSFRSENAEERKKSVTEKVEKLIKRHMKNRNDCYHEMSGGEECAEGRYLLPSVDRGQGQGIR